MYLQLVYFAANSVKHRRKPNLDPSAPFSALLHTPIAADCNRFECTGVLCDTCRKNQRAVNTVLSFYYLVQLYFLRCIHTSTLNVLKRGVKTKQMWRYNYGCFKHASAVLQESAKICLIFRVLSPPATLANREFRRGRPSTTHHSEAEWNCTVVLR